MNDNRFIPTTKEIEIAPGIVYRPIRIWHSAVYAGEKLEVIPGSQDRSGCMRKVSLNGFEWEMCHIPYTYTHRFYWNKKKPKNTISAFLSYPDAMGLSDGEYFWETLATRKDGDIERFFGKDAEARMKKKIIKALTL